MVDLKRLPADHPNIHRRFFGLARYKSSLRPSNCVASPAARDESTTVQVPSQVSFYHLVLVLVDRMWELSWLFSPVKQLCRHLTVCRFVSGGISGYPRQRFHVRLPQTYYHHPIDLVWLITIV